MKDQDYKLLYLEEKAKAARLRIEIASYIKKIGDLQMEIVAGYAKEAEEELKSYKDKK